jgi:hypothetical protein
LPVITLKTLLSSIITYILYCSVIQIVYQRLIAMTLGKRLLIHSYSRRNPVDLSRAPATYRPFQSIPPSFPTQAAEPLHSLNTAFLRKSDHIALKGKCHVRAVFPKLGINLLHTVPWAVHPGRAHVDEGGHLTRIQVTINSLRAMIIHPVKLIALGAPHLDLPLVINVDVDPLVLVIDNHLLHKPRQVDSKYLCKKGFVIHGPNLSEPLHVVYTH